METPSPYREPSSAVQPVSGAVQLAERNYQPSSRAGHLVRTFAKALSVIALAATFGVALFESGAVLALVGGSYLLLLVWLFRRRRQMIVLARANDDAVAALNSGQADSAAQTLDGLLPRSRGYGLLHALMVYNRACVFLRQGQPQRARELLERVANSGWFATGSVHGFDVLLLCTQAVTESVLGNPPRAWQLLDTVRPRVSSLRRGALLHAELIAGCRAERYGEVLQWIDERWRTAEGSLTAAQLRLLRVLEAFASAQREGTLDEPLPPRARTALELARPHRPEEFSYLCAGGWAALEKFVVEHKLVPPREG